VIPARDVAMDGAVVYSCNPDNGAVDWLRRRGLPVAFADQEPTPGISCVNVDDRGGARAAAAHLVGLGHRRVALLTLAAGTGARPDVGQGAGQGADPGAQCSAYVAGERLAGYLEVLHEAGIAPDVHLALRSDDEEAAAVARRLLRRDDRPTAVLCFSDVMAHGVVRAAEELGLRVPADLSVIGYDDSPLARRLRPQLTTVHQDVHEKGRLAASALRAAMHDARTGSPHQPTQVVLPTTLVVRDSTAAPPPS
jgi:DNA-binding LacI/PurR family transcriptional regulator